MVRLMLTLTPVVCVCGAIVVSDVLNTYLDLRSPSPKPAEDSPAVEKTKKTTRPEYRGMDPHANVNKGVYSNIAKVVVVVTFAIYLALFVRHSTYVTSTAYSSPSVVLASRMSDGSQYIIDDYREAYYWLRMNTPDDARIMSWYFHLEWADVGGITATRLLVW